MYECGFGQISQKNETSDMFLPIGISIDKLLKNLTNKHKKR